ncbi:MAG: class I SAM-dependent methyltransferase [Microgenomates group bacterium]
MSLVDKIINNLHNSDFLGRIFHTLNYCLKKELKDCESVLDLGCGPSSPLQYCKWIKYSVGVEIFKPYLEESKKRKIHTKYLNKKIEDVDFPEKSFDAVIMIEVLEHLPKKVGYEILKKAEKWARKKIIVTTPNGFFPMEEVDKNKYQRHLSGWGVEELKKLGFKCRGLGGAKFFYANENKVISLTKEKENIFSNMRFKPKKIMYGITGLTQIIFYFLPKYSFELFCVKIQK